PHQFFLYTVFPDNPYFVVARLLANYLGALARSHSCSVSAAASFIRQLVRMACDPISQGGHNVFFYVILVAARGLDDF
ncbi:hypothetical protein, partial [Pseudomonas sp.]|uniref:hypothetical protein n=1 Tax=Pseudomonas sp. TaxID=306 RepID=UPI0026499B98